MDKNYDQLKIEFSETDKESNSVKFICFFLMLIFALVPLAEIVTDFEYIQIINYSPKYTCFSSLNLPLETLSFKEIK